MIPVSQLQAGDVLLYNEKWDLVDSLIRFRTWSDVAHVEISLGNGLSVASRNGIGVGKYPHRNSGLVKVRRPIAQLDLDGASRWFDTVNGTKYGYSDLLTFYGFKINNHKLICSEFGAQWFINADFQLFASDYATGALSPRDFEITPLLKTL